MVIRKKLDVRSEIYMIIFFIFIGSLCGAVIANNINRIALDSLNRSIKIFFNDLICFNINKSSMFVQEFMKNLKIILFLWLMGFIPFGKLFVCFILFIKGLSYGFTSSLLFNTYKLKGFFYVLKFILPTSFILLPAIIFISVCSIKFLSRIRHINRRELKKNMFEYSLIFIIASACIFLSDLINVYIIK